MQVTNLPCLQHLICILVSALQLSPVSAIEKQSIRSCCRDSLAADVSYISLANAKLEVAQSCLFLSYDSLLFVFICSSCRLFPIPAIYPFVCLSACCFSLSELVVTSSSVSIPACQLTQVCNTHLAWFLLFFHG